MKKNIVWYVTGASQGLGLTLVKKLLANGYRVAATTRNVKMLRDEVGIVEGERFLPLAVDLVNVESIEESVHQTLTAFGRIDVVVNNAGYGMVGAIEDATAKEISALFEINVLSVINVTRTVLPHMRKQQSGHIINIGSVAGFAGAAGWSAYAGSKAAVAAFSEVLAIDVREFNIRVTVVEPSGFRTGFLTKKSLVYDDTKMSAYTEISRTQERYLAADGKQTGDPEKAAEIIIEISESKEPPLHLFLGEDAYKRASAKLTAMHEELEKWKETSIGADFAIDLR